MEIFFLGIITGVLIVVAVFLIPAIRQITRTAKDAENFIRTTQESLNLLIVEIQKTVAKTNQAISKLDETVSDVQQLTKAVGNTGEIIENVNKTIRQFSGTCSVTALSFTAGIKAALEILAKETFKKITLQK